MRSRAATGVIWTAVGAATYAICQWGILAVLARRGSLEDLGVLALSLAVTAPIFLLLGLNLRVVQATDASGQFLFDDYVALRSLTTFAAWLLSVVVAFLWSDLRSYLWIVVGIATAKAAESFFDLAVGRLQLQEKFRSIALLQVSRGIAALVAFAAIFVMFENLTVAVFAWAAVWMIMAMPLTATLARTKDGGAWRIFEPRGNVDIARLRGLWITALPLGGAAVLDSLVLNVPRYILQSNRDAEAVGVFSALAYLMTIGGVAVGAIGYVVTPRLAKTGMKERRRFLGILLSALAVAGSIGIAGVAIAYSIGGSLLGIIYSPQFEWYGEQFAMLMWAALFWYLAGLTGCALNALRRFGLHLIAHALSAITAVCVALVLVPTSGVDGAINATIAAMGVRCFAAVLLLCVCLVRESGRP